MITILLFILNSIPVFALTQDEIVKKISQNLPLIEESQAKLEASKYAIKGAEGEFDHKLSFKSRNRIENKYDNQYFESTIERLTPFHGMGLVLGHRQGLGHFPSYDGKYQTSAAGEMFAGITLPLLRNFKTDTARTNLKIAKLENEQEELQFRLKKNFYTHKALSLFYKWILEEKKLIIRSQLLKLAKDRSIMIEKRFQSGDIEKIKVTDAQRSIDKREDELLKGQLDLQSVKNQLTTLLNLAESEFVSELIANDDPELKLTTFDRKIIENELPQIKLLTLEKQKANLLEEQFKQEKLPGLNLDLLGSRELSGNRPYDPESLQIGVKFDIPLENRKASGKSVSQHYKLLAIEKQLEYAKRELLRSYDYSIRAMELNHQRWQTISKEVIKTKDVAKAESKKWQMGSSDLYSVNLREQDTADAEIRRWNSWYEFHQNILDAKLLVNTI
ncbi:MAG: TolC family protein [Bacteriovoracaceae bacterium]